MAKIPFRAISGVLLIDKARDISSNKALQDVRFTYRAKKAGHTGTLDPFATGLLPVCFGEANKYARWLLDADKTYQFQAIIGQHSSTGDTEGEITVIDSRPQVSEAQLRAAETAIIGDIEQIPPKYSAIKVNGQRAYALARQGHEVIIPTRRVHVFELSLTLAGNVLTGCTRVSKGTYIRTLVEDIAAQLGTVAYCQELRRLQIAHLISDDPASPRDMHTVAEIRSLANATERDKLLLPMDLLCQQFPAQAITGAHWQSLIRGRQTSIDSEQQGMVRLYLDKQFCGLGDIHDTRLKAFRLLNTGF